MDLDVHLAAIAAGDADAFARWVAGAEPRLRRSLRPLAAQVDVEAVLQEALLRIWNAAATHVPDGQPDSLLRLAFVAAKNLARDALRASHAAHRSSLEPLSLLEALPDEQAELPGDPFLREAILLCRETLRGPPALAFAARLDDAGRSPDEALALKLGMRLNTFLQNFGRARKALLACLAKRGVELELGR